LKIIAINIADEKNFSQSCAAVKNMMKITINVPVKIMWVIIAVWQY
jgi:hypothetical protein